MSIPFGDTCTRAALSIIGFPLSVTNQIISKYELMRIKPKGQMVDVGEIQLHALVTGNGTFTVILESGMGGCSLDWCLVQPELSKYAKVVSYDRAGFGWSVKCRDKSTCRDYNNDLRILLRNLNLNPPYILVGHSFGGMNMQLFASEYPDEVVGMVLVDSVHEDRYITDLSNSSRVKQYNQALKQYRLGYLLSPLGIPRIMRMHIGSRRLPSEYLKIVRTLGYRSNAYKAAYKELIYADESGRQVKGSKQNINDELSVIVLSAGKQPDPWKRQQELLKNLTKNTKHIVVEDSWHAIQIHRPEIVIREVKEIINKLDDSAQLTSDNTVFPLRG
ncbi:alpha/beta fold hydrolase [Paenibacillus senegalensis]|uniref:alpha/beta fold hydrolase n=1 Tax=Paenibacillus senegalensis TaxID=1465766 RepID=UPI00028905A8|nr:alpha/beta hydrolase [Paenibacillus senegalensis]